MFNRIVKNTFKLFGFDKKLDSYIRFYINKNLAKDIYKGFLKANWEEIKLNQKKWIKRLNSDLLINCYTDSKLCEFIYKENFEKNELAYLNNVLEPNDIFIDIGANIGLFSILASKCVPPEGKVFSFEPVKTTFDRLLENIALNNINTISAENIALSAEIGVLDMQVSTDGYDAWNSFGKPSGGKEFITMSIPTTTLDQYIKDNYVDVAKIKLIKIDVEGWEIPVIQGAKETLSLPNSPDLLVEFTEANLLGAGFTSNELYKLVKSLGYKWYEFEANSNTLVPAMQRNKYDYCNLVAKKQ